MPSRSGDGQTHLDHSFPLTISSHQLIKLIHQRIGLGSPNNILPSLPSSKLSYSTLRRESASASDTSTGYVLIESSASEPTQACTSCGLTHATLHHRKVQQAMDLVSRKRVKQLAHQFTTITTTGYKRVEKSAITRNMWRYAQFGRLRNG